MELYKLVNENYTNLNENDLYILKFVLNNGPLVSKMTINELASECCVSKSTILRCAKKLGLNGYKDLKVLVDPKFNKTEHSKAHYLQLIEANASQIINQNEEEVINNICATISKSNRIFLYGTGSAQRNFATHLRQLFVSFGKNFSRIEAEWEFGTIIKDLKEDDLLIVISLSGQTLGLQNFMIELRAKGITTVSITSVAVNDLATMTTFNIYGNSPTLQLKNGTTYQSTMFYYVLAEMIINCYADRYC